MDSWANLKFIITLSLNCNVDAACKHLVSQGGHSFYLTGLEIYTPIPDADAHAVTIFILTINSIISELFQCKIATGKDVIIIFPCLLHVSVNTSYCILKQDYRSLLHEATQLQNVFFEKCVV